MKKRFVACLALASGLLLSFAQYSAHSQYGASGPLSYPANALVSSTVGNLGAYLVDSQGFSLYVFNSDTQGQSNCYGACAQVWPPFVVPSGQSPSTSGNAEPPLLGTIQRTDGTQQLTYNGLPLYHYSVDTAPGDTYGQAINSFGANWYLMAPNGTKLLPVAYAAALPYVFTCDSSGRCCDGYANCYDSGFACDVSQRCCDSYGNCYGQTTGGFICDPHGRCCDDRGQCFTIGGGSGCQGFNCDMHGQCCDSCGHCYKTGGNPGSNPGGNPYPTPTPTSPGPGPAHTPPPLH